MNLNLTVKVASVNVVVDESAVAGLESLLARLLGPLARDLLDPILIAHLSPLKDQIMSQLSDAVDAIKAAAADAANRVQEDVQELQRQLSDLQVQLQNEGATPEILAKLAEAKATADGINPLPDFPPVPTP
jgi:hypothetical protein